MWSSGAFGSHWPLRSNRTLPAGSCCLRELPISMKYADNRRLYSALYVLAHFFWSCDFLNTGRAAKDAAWLQVGKGPHHCHVFFPPPDIQGRQGVEEFTPTWCLWYAENIFSKSSRSSTLNAFKSSISFQIVPWILSWKKRSYFNEIAKAFS